jgi:hypothetical protein
MCRCRVQVGFVKHSVDDNGQWHMKLQSLQGANVPAMKMAKLAADAGGLKDLDRVCAKANMLVVFPHGTANGAFDAVLHRGAASERNVLVPAALAVRS